MAEHLVILNKPHEWSLDLPGAKIITPEAYLTDPAYAKLLNTRVLNLCRNYSYLSNGYYCSLLAEARRHKVLPTVKSLQDLTRKSLYQTLLEDVTPGIVKSLDDQALEQLEVESYFGYSPNTSFSGLTREVFARLPFPALSIHLKRKGGVWILERLKPIDIQKLSDTQAWLLWSGLQTYISKRWRTAKEKPQDLYDLAILINPAEEYPPSNEHAIDNFIFAAKKNGMHADIVYKKDLHRLAEYDALFIRETTSIEHYTYRYARKAQADGMVVIDEPETILRCANKVYLAELLNVHRIPTPRTTILHRHNLHSLMSTLALPVVLKIPDGSFSRGVKKAETIEEAKRIAKEMLRESELILAQEYLYTEFDWRVGIIDRKPLFVCQYYMTTSHWQIINHNAPGVWGDLITVPVGDTPRKVVETALKAANLIGDGLFGVDLKQLSDGRVVVIEVNDNPNIEAGEEDRVLKDELYQTIMQSFRNRLDVKMRKK